MLTKEKYNKGLTISEQIKYNINYNKCALFEIVRANLAQKLLNSEYVELCPKQEEALNKLINK